VALNAAVAGIDAVGLQPGDRVLTIDGEPATTFSNIEIAAAMSKPGNAITLSVERPGAKEPLIFELQPEKSPATGLLAIGVTPGSSTLLVSAKDDDDGSLARLLERVGLAAQGVKPGMVLISANGEDVASFGQVGQMARNSGGKPLQTHWATLNDKGERSGAVDATLNVAPDMEDYRQRATGGDAGLVGFSPLVRFQRTSDDSANAGRILPGDVLVRIADVEYPRQSQLMETLQKHRRQDIALIVLRNGERTPITAHVNKDGLLRVEISPADDLLITAQPVQTYARYRADDAAKVENVQTPAGRAGLFTTGGTRIVQVAGKPVSTWTDLRESLLAALPAGGGDASVEVLVEHPLVGSPREKVTLDLNADEVKRLQALRWHLELPGGVFEPIYTVRKGGPLKALSMGFEETRKMVMMTYLTLDRLIRGSVGVEQLRGPVGIVQIGAKVARQGMIYLLFLLGAISVNLAVINFLPLPILDGSLFLYLVYEKFKGRPPSLAFQNVTTIVGAVMLATLLIVVTYNDVLRLFS
jgi:regulator of sigma E protease